jgi:hypothetical protein
MIKKTVERTIVEEVYEFCCKPFEAHWDNGNIGYDNDARLADKFFVSLNHEVMMIRHCPFCGVKLDMVVER